MLPESIENAISELLNVPGFGKRGAQKLALDLLTLKDEKFSNLLNSIIKMKKSVVFCKTCGYFTDTNNELCNICDRVNLGNRDKKKICIVEKPTDVLNLEKTLIYNGSYHVIEKLISPIDNIFATDTNISKLFEDRVPDILNNFKQDEEIELILFLKPGFSADTTIAYIKDVIKNKGWRNVKITQLAQGLPLYYTADNLDQATMIKALEDRKELF